MQSGHCSAYKERSWSCVPPTRGRVIPAYTFKFDSRKGATWHCIVGQKFGSFVTHGKEEITIFDTLVFLMHSHRNETFHLLLHRTLRDSIVQDPVMAVYLGAHSARRLFLKHGERRYHRVFFVIDIFLDLDAVIDLY